MADEVRTNFVALHLRGLQRPHELRHRVLRRAAFVRPLKADRRRAGRTIRRAVDRTMRNVEQEDTGQEERQPGVGAIGHAAQAVDDRVVARVVVAEQHELRRPRHERRSSDRNVGTRPDRGRQHNSGDPPGASPARSRELHGGTIPVHEAPLVAVLFRAS